MSLITQKTNLPSGYEPSDSEEYMNPLQLEFFRQKLIFWKQDLLQDSNETLEHLKENELHQADISTRASAEEQTSFELRTRNRYRKLISKIDLALERINDGNYGYCEETGEEIGVHRLKARPIATLSLEAQERHENYERLHNTDDLEVEDDE